MPAIWISNEPLAGSLTYGGDMENVVHHALSDLDPVGQAILRLLAQGYTDHAVARQLNLGHRTVERRIAYLTMRLGATSRFQLGALAACLGMIGLEDLLIPLPRVNQEVSEVGG